MRAAYKGWEVYFTSGFGLVPEDPDAERFFVMATKGHRVIDMAEGSGLSRAYASRDEAARAMADAIDMVEKGRK